MPSLIDTSGARHQVQLTPDLYARAHEANLGLPAYLSRLYPNADLKHGTAFQQFCVSEGVYLPKDRSLGLRSSMVGDVLEGKAALQFGAAVVEQKNTDYGGTQSRILFPAAVVEMIENQLQKDLVTDTALFDKMVAVTLGVASDTFEQPVINYSTQNGPDGANRAKAQRIAQLAEPAAMASFTTSQTPRRLPTWSIGAEFSDQALRNTTLDLVALALARFLAVERDGRVYTYLSDLWGANPDMGTAAITAVTTTSLDAAATGGVITHKSWVKWLYRNRKYRRIDYVVCDLDTYLKIEGRTGRPGFYTSSQDATLPKIDPQARAMNPYVDSVQVMLVDAAVDGGPVPANTVWGVDSRFGIVKVSNTTAAYTAAEKFALKRSEAFRMDWSETAYRQFDTAFDVLTIL
jgi:hypothetical protein